MRSWKRNIILVCGLSLLAWGCKSADSDVKPDDSAAKAEAKAKADAAVEDAAKTVTEAHDDDALRAALADKSRPVEDIERDAWRHPYETLTFFEVKPESKVLELWAGRGWYTQVLAPYVGGQGKLYVTAYAPQTGSEYLQKMTAEFRERLTKMPYGDKVGIIEVNPPTVPLDFGMEGQLDVVLTFRNVHNWAKAGYEKDVYAQAFKALKSGGIFGVVEHRGPDGMTAEQSAKSGYMSQAKVIEDVKAAGFELVEASEINANAKDTKDHPEGVWTLPPSLRLKEQDKEKYMAIGESDRMTLKFRKP